MLVMNADLLTKVNFGNLLTYHAKHNAKATMCVREYDFQVPYGVVNLDDHRLLSRGEADKALLCQCRYLSLEPDVLDFVPKDTFSTCRSCSSG